LWQPLKKLKTEYKEKARVQCCKRKKEGEGGADDDHKLAIMIGFTRSTKQEGGLHTDSTQ